MKILSFVLIALVGTMVLGLPLQSYADPQLDTLLSIATQARDNLGITLSQTSNTPNEINQLYKQGSNETDELAKAVAQEDVNSAKEHFLAAMQFFKETNDQINSLNATAVKNQQQAEIIQLQGEIIRLDSMENLLKTIATNNNIEVNFTKFDELIQTAQQDLGAGNVDDATTAIKNANDFLVQTHNSLTTIAQERIVERAKDFTEKQIERFSKMNEFNATNSTIYQTSPSASANATGMNTTNNASTTPPIQTHAPPIPPIQQPAPPQTPPPTVSSTISVQNNSSIVTEKNPEQMLAELKKLMSEGKINEALKVIKLIEAYQKEKSTTEKVERSSSSTNSVENATNNASTTPPIQTPAPPIPPIQQPAPPQTSPSASANATGMNTTNNASTTPPIQTPAPPIPPIQQPAPPQTSPSASANTTETHTPNSAPTQSNIMSSTPNDHEKYNSEKDKQNKQHNDHQNPHSGHD